MPKLNFTTTSVYEPEALTVSGIPATTRKGSDVAVPVVLNTATLESPVIVEPAFCTNDTF